MNFNKQILEKYKIKVTANAHWTTGLEFYQKDGKVFVTVGKQDIDVTQHFPKKFIDGIGSDSDDGVELEIHLEADISPGYKATLEEPGAPDDADIVSVELESVDGDRVQAPWLLRLSCDFKKGLRKFKTLNDYWEDEILEHGD